jgi:hypothetical protein
MRLKEEEQKILKNTLRPFTYQSNKNLHSSKTS